MMSKQDLPPFYRVAVADLIPYARNARTHSPDQVAQIAASIREWMIIGDYAVSKSGIILALPYQQSNRWGGLSGIKAKFIALSNDKNGYKLATMRRLGWNKNGQVRVHRLVAHCWIGPCPEGMEVNHKDGDKANNHADNLEYVTSKQNKIHAVENGLMKIGRQHHNTKKIRVEKNGVVKILYGVREIEEMGFHPQSVHRAARGERSGYHGWSVSYV